MHTYVNIRNRNEGVKNEERQRNGKTQNILLIGSSASITQEKESEMTTQGRRTKRTSHLLY